ncbi:MAG: sigma-70 family RNA polymerase sigma factor [Planctomycetaceae bacterium]
MLSAGEFHETAQLLDEIERGDRAAVNRLLDLYRPYLKRVIELRIDPELRARIDPSDLVQDTQLVAVKRMRDFLKRRPTTFRLWLRRKALEQLVDVRRRHLGAQKRSVRGEIGLSEASSLAVVHRLRQTSPSKAAEQKELVAHVRMVMDQLAEMDRDVLLLRHVEELSNAEVAELLEIEPAAASKRYGRAVRRLSERLANWNES